MEVIRLKEPVLGISTKYRKRQKESERGREIEKRGEEVVERGRRGRNIGGGRGRE